MGSKHIKRSKERYLLTQDKTSKLSSFYFILFFNLLCLATPRNGVKESERISNVKLKHLLCRGMHGMLEFKQKGHPMWHQKMEKSIQYNAALLILEKEIQLSAFDK